MKHRFILVETVIENAKQQLLEAGEILIRSIKTGQLYPVKKFNPKNHMKPTPAQIDKYYREKAGIFPSDAAKAKYNKAKPKAKKKKLPPKKMIPNKKIAPKKKKSSVAIKPKKKKTITKTISFDPDDLFELSDGDAQMLIDDLGFSFGNEPYEGTYVEKYNDHVVVMKLELPNGKKQTVYVGIENTKSAGGTYAKLVGTEDPKLKAFFLDAYGKPTFGTFYDVDDIEVALGTDHWIDDINDGERDSINNTPVPYHEPEGGKEKSKPLDTKSFSPQTKKRVEEWRKQRVAKNHGQKYLTGVARTLHTAKSKSVDKKLRNFSKYEYRQDSQPPILKIEDDYDFKKDYSEDVDFQTGMDIEPPPNVEFNNNEKAVEDILENVTNTQDMINKEMSYPLYFRNFVGDDYEDNSWKLAKLSNMVFGHDPKDDYRYKSQRASQHDIKPDKQWKKDAAVLKKVMKEQQEVLKKLGFVNDDGTVTLVRAISVDSSQVPAYTKENKGIVEADYTGSAADSWTLSYNTANGWDQGEGDASIVVKARVPLEKVIASSYGLPSQHIMQPFEQEVIINSRDLQGVELYPDYDGVAHGWGKNYKGDEEIPKASVLNKRAEKIMENEKEITERRRKKNKKVKVNINNKRNIDWLRSGKKNNDKKRK